MPAVYFRKTARPGRYFCASLLFCLSLMLFSGQLVAQAEPSTAQAEFMAGLALEYRPDAAPDYAGAAGHYRAAAAAGSREALLALARLSQPNGPLWTKAETWRDHLVEAARAGWAEAAFQLAEALEQKLVEGLNPINYYFQAAATGHGPAALRLGQLYLEGAPDLPQNQRQGLIWLTVAAENREPRAALILGRLYYPDQPDLARRWLEKAQSPEAAYMLGRIYLNDKRYIEALSALTVAADQHYPPAHLALGLLDLDNDFGRKPNPREALRHFKIAAQADLPEGAYRLALMYLTGQATPKDNITGAFWLHRAAGLGYEPAREEYDKLVYNFTVGQKKRLERMIEEGLAPTTQTQVQ